MEKAIKQTRHFRQSPEEVWEFLTKPELIEQWLGQSDFQPVVGHKFQFTSSYGNHSYCEVLEVNPYTRLCYSWQKNSAKDGKPFDSKVAWTLVPKESGTELQLIHDGFTTVEDVAAHENGWNICLQQMEKLTNPIKI
jgi:uncharacterized protein YndB with AHSA1/START domain